MTQPETAAPSLRDRIAHALEREDAINAGYDHGFVSSYGVDPETDGFVDAVLAVLPAPVDRAGALTEAERTMLVYALDQAQERIWSEGGFTAEDQAAVDSLRRLAAEAHTGETCTNCRGSGLDPRYNGEFDCPDCPQAAEAHTDTQDDGPPDTFPAWLARRFDPQGAPWDGMSDDDRSYWEHQARAVRRAVERGGFKAVSSSPVSAAPRHDEDRIVAYRSPGSSALHCVGCTPFPVGDIWTPVTAEELEHGGGCTVCGVDVLIPQQQREV